MTQRIKKTNLMLGLLVMAFFTVSLSLLLEIQTSSLDTHKQPIIIEIEGHLDIPITHGGDEWPLACGKCHTQPVYGECTDPDCHPSPDYWVGDDNATYFAHHDLSYTGFMDCWSSDCHDPDPNDVRYVKTDLIEDNDWHKFCDKCHAEGTHD